MESILSGMNLIGLSNNQKFAIYASAVCGASQLTSKRQMHPQASGTRLMPWSASMPPGFKLD
jgi:hypothetical protein